MSTSNTPFQLIPSSMQFRQHPDSIAERLHNEAMSRIRAELATRSSHSPTGEGLNWLDVTAHNTPQEAGEFYRNTLERAQPRRAETITLCEPRVTSACPLDASWATWDMFGSHARFNQLSSPGFEICADARRTVPILHLGLVQLQWESAHDDLPMAREDSGAVWRWRKGSPAHLHAEASVNGKGLHIDRVTATKYGPGRSFLEFRIFVDGQLTGRGGRCGCSLGMGGNDLPAVGRLASTLAITVDDVAEQGEPVVELWEVAQPK